MWSNIKVSPIFSKSKFSNKFLKDFTPQFKELISAARYIQSPIAETLNLWSDNEQENALLKISYHNSQNMISLKKLQSQFETVILEVVNKCGVDINQCLKHPHLASPLQFVCGLGPRKAKSLINNINKSDEDIIF